MDAFRAALVLTVKSMVLGTRWAGRQRQLWLETACQGAGELAALRKQAAGDLGKRQGAEPVNKTPRELVEMIWGMLGANPHWGRRRIAMTMRLLGIFIAASTVRNVLLRPRPRPTPLPAPGAQPNPVLLEPRQVVARYPGHVWSVDRTRVYLWGLWPTWVLVAIDHYSRKVVMATAPVTDAAGCVAPLQSAFREHGAPKCLISDQESVFTSEALKELLTRWNVQHRFGAVGKQGSIAVTERVIWTLKYEWLRRVVVIRGIDHLTQLLDDFSEYCNGWRGHRTLRGATPLVIHRGDARSDAWQRPCRSAKQLSGIVECRFFPDTRTTAYRLAA